MIHTSTKNTSFLKVCQLLRQKGIKNRYFFLELFDEELENVDPYDPNLSDEMKARVAAECQKNFWYFIREVVRVQSAGSSMYELNLGNLALSWACINDINSYTVMPRQCGKTFGVMIVILWIEYFRGHNTQSMLFAQTDKNLQNNLSRIKSTRDALPEYLQFGKGKEDRDGSELVFFKELGTTIKKQAPKRSEEGADSVGRGQSAEVLNYDEFAFIPHIKTQYQASVLAQTTVAKRAEKAGLPHFISITTTAAFLNTESGIYAFEFFENCLLFSEDMYDASVEDVKSQIATGAKRNFLRIEYSYWELGKSDDYFNEQQKSLGYDRDAIDREVLNIWKAVSKTHPLGQQAVVNLENNIRKPVKVLVLNKIFRMRLFKDPTKLDWGTPFVIAGDCADNVGSDYSALVVIDPYTYEVVATLRSNMYSTMKFAQMIADLMTNMFFKSVLVLERNYNGGTVIDRILEINYDLRSRIYGPAPDPSKPNKQIPLGIRTDKNTRPIIYGQILKMTVDDSYDRIYDQTIINEIKALIIGRNGRIDHPPGGHDDILISLLFGRWFLLYGEYLDRYLDPLIIGSLYNRFVPGEKNDMKELKDQTLKEARDKQEEEFEELQRKKKSKDSSYGYLQSIREQDQAIRNGSFNGIEDVGEDYLRGHSKSNGGISGVFKKAADLIEERESLEEAKNPKNAEKRDTNIYTLDDEEIEKMENYEESDPEYEERLYNSRTEDINFNKHKLNHGSEFVRNVRAKTEGDDIHSLGKFFKGQMDSLNRNRGGGFGGFGW